MNWEQEQWPNGLRLAVSHMPHMESVTVGVWLAVGGRHETPETNGVAHFVEHMLFKGTKTRNSRQISQAVEGLGGYLNAFTSEEATCYFARASARHLPLLVDVLLDMILHSTMPKDEIERERGVILEEIRMYEDQPNQVAQERAAALLFQKNPLGQPLAGSIKLLEQFKETHLRSWLASHYHAGNLVITVSGKASLEQVRKLLMPHLGKLPKTKQSGFKAVGRAQSAPRHLIIQKPIEQTHLVIATRGLSRKDPRRFALRLASILLGENMSSRLFQIVREQRGLAYSISTQTSHYADTGSFYVQAGLENSQTLPALKLILKTIQRLSEKAPTTSELRRAKEYFYGQMHLGLESTENQMVWLGESFIGYNRIPTPEYIVDQFESITPEEVRAATEIIANPRLLNVVLVTPEKNISLDSVMGPSKSASIAEGRPALAAKARSRV